MRIDGRHQAMMWIIRGGCGRFQDDKVEAGERQARDGRGMTKARWGEA
jgi:hypothetical protein